MKKLSGFVLIMVIVQLLVLSSCKEKENETPTVEIVSPEDGIMIMQGDPVTIKATASDSDGSVELMYFYVDYVLMTELTDPPYEFLWTGSDSTIGDVLLRVIGVDNDGEGISSEVTIVVDAPGGFNPDLTYGTVADFDGNTYKTIEIGEQNWMAENLKVTHYADGTAVPYVSDDTEWLNLDDSGKGYCWYDNMTGYADTTGALYSWSGAMNGAPGMDSIEFVQGVCPDGWHLPGDEEWKKLEMQLGMSQEAADGFEWRGSDEGSELKEVGFSHWDNPNSGADNTSGYTALPGGFRSHTGTFYGVGQYATFWSASEKSGSDNIWYRVLYFEETQVYRHYNNRNQGLSVRCVQDQ